MRRIDPCVQNVTPGIKQMQAVLFDSQMVYKRQLLTRDDHSCGGSQHGHNRAKYRVA